MRLLAAFSQSSEIFRSVSITFTISGCSVVVKSLQQSLRAFIPCILFRKLFAFLCSFDSRKRAARCRCGFRWILSPRISRRASIILFLIPVDELKSIKCFTLLASRDVRTMKSLQIFSVLVFSNLNGSFDRDDISCVCSSSMLFCGSFESCENSNKFSDCNYIGSGSIFKILICWMCEPVPQKQFTTFFWNFSKMKTFHFDKYMHWMP